MQPILNIAIHAARQAGDIILRHIELIDRIKVNSKGVNDFFSEVDVKAEQAIIQTIHKLHPNHGIIAEESGISNLDADCVWIIDPLDGTKNFLHGFPFYCVSIAIRIKGSIEHAVVYDPLRHECFSATRGRGARLDDRRLRVSKQTQLKDSLVACATPIPSCGGSRKTGSAALDLAYVASGRLDGFYENSLKIWDIAAGCLIVREAGGLLSDKHGKDGYLESGEVVASTPKIFKALLQSLNA